mmetsp:Transcript_24549/g.53641  ORF Transcript_24549/g.53641 Transcript_24549/m.53641 type:complete len:326 (-) Transcript_24549:865-1842(-)
MRHQPQYCYPGHAHHMHTGSCGPEAWPRTVVNNQPPCNHLHTWLPSAGYLAEPLKPCGPKPQVLYTAPLPAALPNFARLISSLVAPISPASCSHTSSALSLLAACTALYMRAMWTRSIFMSDLRRDSSSWLDVLILSYSARAACMLSSSLATSSFSSEIFLCFALSPPNTLAPATSRSRMARCLASRSACSVLAVSSCFSRWDRPFTAAGMKPRNSCRVPSSTADLPVARLLTRDTRTRDVPNRFVSPPICWCCLTVPVNCARPAPSTSSALATLNMARPRSPCTALWRSMRCTSFSAAFDAVSSCSLSTSSCSLARLRSSSSSL